MIAVTTVLFLCAAMVTSQSPSSQPLQGLKVPPGSRVELEVEIPPSATAGQRSQTPMSASGMRMFGPSSVTQQLLTNMAQISMRMRRMTNVPIPPMEEPCPCDGDCCDMPMEPRRLVPVLHLPMTSHIGCCGCIDCPLSAYPLIGQMIMSAVMSDQARGISTMGVQGRRR